MNESLQHALMMANGKNPTSFPVTSRYHGVETTAMELAEGTTVVFLRRRFIPSADHFQLLQTHKVIQGERLDNITAKYLGDPEQFWRLCDANNATRPEELAEIPGRELRITLPQGIGGPTL